jgi:predicted nucleotidyltransferase
MRLTERQIRIIKEEVRHLFGPVAQVWVFGSRVDDSARGGDIDLLIEADAEPDEALDKELRLHTRLIRRLGDQHIGVIVHRTGAPSLPIHQVAQQTGKRL